MPAPNRKIKTEELVELYNELGNLRAVGEVVGLSHEAVRLRLLPYEGLVTRTGHRRTPADDLSDEEIRAIYDEVQTIAKAAQRVGCSPGAMSRRLKEAGADVRPGGLRSPDSLIGRVVAFLEEVGPPARTARQILDGITERGYTTTSTLPIRVINTNLWREAQRERGWIGKAGNLWYLRSWIEDDEN